MDPGPPQPTPINIRLVQDMPGPPPPPPPPPPEDDAVPPAPESSAKRDAFYKYWDRFLAEKPNGKRTKSSRPTPKGQSGLPSLDVDVEGNPSHMLRENAKGELAPQPATTSYKEAAENCKAKVRAIVNECKRLNVKYSDRNFVLPYPDALNSLGAEIPGSMNTLSGIGSVKRVEDIFEKPQFIVDGATANDVRQGQVGDCWFLAAITALSGKKELIDRICVDQDEKVGVYGFVFFRDGEWISEIVDDNLPLKRADDERRYPTEFFLSVLGDTNVQYTGITSDMQQGQHYNILRLEKEYKEKLRKGSNSLYFASCRESNETWLPLLEKAYAKAHGDYQAISGGFAGEGIEDLTGGVSTYIFSESVLDKDKLWSELMQVNETSGFLFGCGSRQGRDADPLDEEGFVRGHAYTVLNAKEIKDPKDKEKTLRLLKIRNPWGDSEWNGAWSDGSKEWTADTMRELDHTFGDDGIFWIAYTDWLKYFPDFERTRLFGPEWTVAQQWTSVNVPWNTEYLDTKFDVTLEEGGPVVLVLSQPDDRYFTNLGGRHTHRLHFRLYKKGEETYIARSLLETGSGRSCSAELELEPGNYTVNVKIESSRYEGLFTPEEVIKMYRTSRRDKLLATGRAFDISHSKGRLRERENANAKEAKDAQRKEDKDELKRRRAANKKERLRERARNKRKEDELKRKKAIKKEEMLKEREETKAKKDAAKAAKAKAKADNAADKATTTITAESSQAEKPADETKVNDVPDDSSKPEAAAIAASTEAEVAKATATSNMPDTSAPAKIIDESSATDSTQQQTPESSKASGEVEAKEGGEAIVAETSKDNAEAAKESAEATNPANATEPSTKEEAKDEKPGAQDEEEEDEDEDIPDDDIIVSEVDDNDFDWDSDIDGPSDAETESDDEPGMYASDPWNATCVIGLRIYSHCKTAKITVVEKAQRPRLGDRQVSKA